MIKPEEKKTKERFYITTPLYYVNGVAHLGHAYTTVLADVLARYQRLSGDREVHFLTGLDEHGQKVAQAAAANNKTPEQHCDEMAVSWKNVWQKLNIKYDDLIRTTEPRHEKVVSEILMKLHEQDDIYTKEYEGWYSVSEEMFFTEKDLVDGKDPILGRPVEKRKETNYFFKMSKYQDWLIDHYKSNPDAVIPSFRLNEVLGFLKQPLGDLCISRPRSRLSWGIPIPWDDEYVTYVWFDALLNYYSATLTPPEGSTVEWPADYHLIGKDILTTHAVYWPIMLHAAGIEPPRHILAHGWWLDKDAARMSKSEGNVVKPLELADKYGADAFRYYLMRDMVVGQDASFSEASFVRRYNSDLANDLGNLFSRLAKLWHKFDWGTISKGGTYDDAVDAELGEEYGYQASKLKDLVENEISSLRPHAAIEHIMQVVRALNWAVDHFEPWKEERGRSADVALSMCSALDILFEVALLLEPIMPDKMKKLQRRIMPGNVIDPQFGDPLFPRLKLKKEPAKVELKAKSNMAEITIDDFKKLDLRIGIITKVEPVPESDRLLKLQVDIGREQRQVVAGIAEDYEAADLIGKQVALLANLKPVKLRGVTSQGMLLAANDGSKLTILSTDLAVKLGTKVS